MCCYGGSETAVTTKFPSDPIHKCLYKRLPQIKGTDLTKEKGDDFEIIYGKTTVPTSDNKDVFVIIRTSNPNVKYPDRRVVP